MHVVHKLSDNCTQFTTQSRLVVGVLFNYSDTANQLLTDLDVQNLTVVNVSLAAHLTTMASTGYYHYNGSLTTPACDEVVNWFVGEGIQPCTQEQVGYFTSRANNTYRVVQPANGRVVYHAKFVPTPTLTKAGSFMLVSILAAIGLAILVVLNCVHLSCKKSALANNPNYNKLLSV